MRIGARSNQPQVRASAFQSPAGDQVTIVLLNTGAIAATVALDAGGYAAARAAAYLTTFNPGASQVWRPVSPPAATGNPLMLPPRSVATLVLWRFAGAP